MNSTASSSERVRHQPNPLATARGTATRILARLTGLPSSHDEQALRRLPDRKSVV